MPDEMSPEERLLQLIKGGENPSPKKDQPEKQGADATPANDDKNDDKNTGGTEPEPPVKKPVPPPVKRTPPQEKKLEPKPVRNEQKTVHSEPEKPVAPEPDNPKPVKKSVAKSEDKKEIQEQPVKQPSPAVAPQPIVPPSEQNQDSAEEDSEKDESETTRKKRAGIVLLFVWLFSGFTVLNRLLLVVVLMLIGLSIYYVYNLPKPELETPVMPSEDMVTEPDNESAGTEQQYAMHQPKPFPYYVEEIGKKKLFRLINPPPPPKPPEPERKEPEAPKIKIETLTRHLVLQGIVYDIGPPQAIVFDKKENKTLFLGNNDMVTDQVKIKEIQRGKIILEFEDQTQELNFQ